MPDGRLSVTKLENGLAPKVRIETGIGTWKRAITKVVKVDGFHITGKVVASKSSRKRLVTQQERLASTKCLLKAPSGHENSGVAITNTAASSAAITVWFLLSTLDSSYPY